jgi:tRNA(adenine34) deaminase
VDSPDNYCSPVGKVPNELDLRMMARCIALSHDSVAAGELPFGCVICRDGEVVAESTNRVKRDRDVIRHAEIVAMSQAQRVLGTNRLSRCTLYSSVEPCGMCSYCIRETRMRKVVYAIRSPIMGGHSKWKLLQDKELSGVLPEVFGSVPEIMAEVMREEAEAVWQSWHPLIWKIIKLRGCFHRPSFKRAAEQAAPGPDGLLRWLMSSHN